MASIIVKSSWPTDSSRRVGERWLEMSPSPEYMKLMWAGIHGVQGTGIEALVFWQVEDPQIAGAYEYLKQDVSRYFDVPGYTYSIDLWTDAQNALKMVGLA